MKAGRIEQTGLLTAVLVLSLTGCGGDGGTSPNGSDGYSQAEIYPIGVGYSWTYVHFDTMGTPRDTATVTIQEDLVDGDTHHLTKCWLDGAGLCPMDEVVTASAVRRQTFDDWCDVLRFPLRVGDSWTTCHGLLIRVVRTEDLVLRTGREFRDAVAVEIHSVGIRIDEQGNEIGLDTVLVETDHFAREWGQVAVEPANPRTGRAWGRSEILRCSFRQR